MSKHIVLMPWGSLGDLHPLLVLSLEMQRRGHRVTLATMENYRQKIEDVGVGFHATRPAFPPPDELQAIMQRVMNAKSGTEFLFRGLLMPNLRDSYHDLSAIAPDCDLCVTHPAQMAGPLVAQKFGLRWASCVLAPISQYSAFDPPVLPHPIFSVFQRLGQRGTSLSFRLMHLATRHWISEVALLRRELGLPVGLHPMFDGQYSPQLNLALFSSALGEPQPDWPANSVQTGFLFYDTKGAIEMPRAFPPSFETNVAACETDVSANETDGDLSPGLTQFLKQGDAPLVFTLGSAVVIHPGNFFRESARAARLLGQRAVLLGDTRNCGGDDEKIASFDYAPYSQLFPRACAIVHQGGVGTTAQAMRAGKPQLIVPHSHDQPDNAARIVRRQLGRTLPLHQYQAPRVARELRKLLDNIEYSKRARAVGETVQAENGLQNAADALETLLATSPQP